jgi:hypothetical protein
MPNIAAWGVFGIDIRALAIYHSHLTFVSKYECLLKALSSNF